jgi:hypothetical protein
VSWAERVGAEHSVPTRGRPVGEASQAWGVGCGRDDTAFEGDREAFSAGFVRREARLFEWR